MKGFILLFFEKIKKINKMKTKGGINIFAFEFTELKAEVEGVTSLEPLAAVASELLSFKTG